MACEELRVLKDILNGMLSLILLVLSIYTYMKFKNLQTQYNQMLQNWDQGLVMDIDYEDETGCQGPNMMTWNYTWPGSMNACDCRDGRYHCLKSENMSTSIYHHRLCNSTQLNCGCDQINAVPPKNVTYWKSTKRICLLREPTLIYHSLAKYRYKNGTCKNNTKICGDLNDPYKKICVPENLDRCPINSIMTNKRKSPDPTYFNESLEFFPGTKLFWSRNYPSSPLVEIRMTEDRVCLLNNDTNISPGRKDNEFMNVRRSRCSKKNQDPRFQLLDDWGELDLFTFNKVPFRRVKYYHTSNFYRWNLFHRGFLPWHPSCDPHSPKLYIQKKKIERLSFHEKVLLIITIISFTIISFIIYIELKGKKEDKEMIIFCTEYSPLFNFIAKIFSLPSLVINYKLAENMYNFNYMLFELKCSDEINNQLFKELGIFIEFDIYKAHFYGILTVVGLLVSESIAWFLKINQEYNEDRSSSSSKSSSYVNSGDILIPLEDKNGEMQDNDFAGPDEIKENQEIYEVQDRGVIIFGDEIEGMATLHLDNKIDQKLDWKKNKG